MNSSYNVALAELRGGPLYLFVDWPNPAVPNGRIGVYTVWRGDQLVYVGMAGRTLGPGANSGGSASAKITGLRSRLASHASGRRSGDQFCVYVFDCLVLPTLSRQRIVPEASRPHGPPIPPSHLRTGGPAEVVIHRRLPDIVAVS